MPRVLVTRPIPFGGDAPLRDAGLDIVEWPGTPPNHDELTNAASEFDAMICILSDRIDRAVLDSGRGRLQVVANVAVGYDNIDVAHAKDVGITICNTPGVLDDATADIALLLLLAAARLASEAESDLRGGRWDGGWRVDDHLGQEVCGATLGLVGYGRIAQAVARRAAGFGMTILHHTRSDTGEAGWVADLDVLLGRSDFISIHVPQSGSTVNLIDARRFALMKPTSVFVNTARGAVVNEEALADALEDGTIFAAGLDVYANEPKVHPRLLTAPRAVLFPHIGSATKTTRRRMGTTASQAVVDVLAGRRPACVVE